MMKLDEEITICQFAQGIQSEVDLVKRFSQLDEAGKMTHFLELNTLIRQAKSTDADFQQALDDNSLTIDDLPSMFVRTDRVQIGRYSMLNVEEGDHEKAYTFLLYVFKVIYQRRSVLSDPTDWRYWDLSNPEIVQHIQTRHHEIVEAVYANASYRSEFVSIAKLWHERNELQKAQMQEPAPGRQTRFPYMSYDEMITKSIELFTDKQRHGIDLLQHSVSKAISKQYGLATNEANQVVLEVIERHLRETYNTDLF